MNKKEQYCMGRAEYLNQNNNIPLHQGYEIAEKEWNNPLTFSDNSLLTTGAIFQATDALNETYTYHFRGLNINDPTGCAYVSLYNETLDTETNVEWNWFQNREITILSSQTLENTNDDFDYDFL